MHSKTRFLKFPILWFMCLVQNLSGQGKKKYNAPFFFENNTRLPSFFFRLEFNHGFLKSLPNFKMEKRSIFLVLFALFPRSISHGVLYAEKNEDFELLAMCPSFYTLA